MEHVIILPSKGEVSAWIDNDLKYIDPREQHQIWILSGAVDSVMNLKQVREGATGLRTMVTSPNINTS